jgi:hypothetical protein
MRRPASGSPRMRRGSPTPSDGGVPGDPRPKERTAAMSERDTSTPDQLRLEVESLRAENRRLRSLLGSLSAPAVGGQGVGLDAVVHPRYHDAILRHTHASSNHQ